MKRIMIVGAGGVGKSTLAQALGEELNIEVFHLDKLLWKPGWELTTREEQREIQRGLAEGDTWIIDGNYGATMDTRMQYADTIIFLDLPRILTVYRVWRRMRVFKGKTRPDMADGCPEKLDFGFIRWVWNFRRDKRPALMKKLGDLQPDKQVIHLRSRREVRSFLEKVSAEY